MAEVQDAIDSMQLTEPLQCPFCGETCDVPIDTSVPEQTFITDCEVCCRPFEVSVKSAPGEVLQVDVRGS